MSRPKRDAPNARGIPEAARGNANDLRQRLTDPEKLLWGCLRDRQLGGLKFRRQHPVGPYVLDFYCPIAKLAVEIDGGIHDTQKEWDADRTAHLERYGYRVIRFSNEEVLTHPEDVLKRILDAANKKD